MKERLVHVFGEAPYLAQLTESGRVMAEKLYNKYASAGPQAEVGKLQHMPYIDSVLTPKSKARIIREEGKS